MAAAVLDLCKKNASFTAALETGGTNSTKRCLHKALVLESAMDGIVEVEPKLIMRKAEDDGGVPLSSLWKSIAVHRTVDGNALDCQHLRNFREICAKLTSLMESKPAERLAAFGRYIAKRVEVVVTIASSEDAALRVFGVVNTPGEPLDLSSMLKWKLSDLYRGPHEGTGSYLLRADMSKEWNSFEVELGEAVNDAALSMCRGWAKDLALDGSFVVKTVNAVFREWSRNKGDTTSTDTAPRPPAALSAYFRRCFATFRTMRDLPRDGTAVTDIENAIGYLLALQDMATAVDVRSNATVWQAVLLAVLEAMEVSVYTKRANGSHFVFERAGKAETLTTIFRNMEAILLRAYLCRGDDKSTKSYLHERMTQALHAAWKLNPNTIVTDLHSPELVALLATDDDKKSLAVALDGPLYAAGDMTNVAMRHVVMRAATLDQGADRYKSQTKVSLLAAYRADWTVEHIFSQSGANASREAVAYFNTDIPGSGPALHRLGNLLPLEKWFNSVARDKPYAQKRDLYHQSQMPGVKKLPRDEFGDKEFQERHDRLLGYLGDAFSLTEHIAAVKQKRTPYASVQEAAVATNHAGVGAGMRTEPEVGSSSAQAKTAASDSAGDAYTDSRAIINAETEEDLRAFKDADLLNFCSEEGIPKDPGDGLVGRILQHNRDVRFETRLRQAKLDHLLLMNREMLKHELRSEQQVAVAARAFFALDCPDADLHETVYSLLRKGADSLSSSAASSPGQASAQPAAAAPGPTSTPSAAGTAGKSRKAKARAVKDTLAAPSVGLTGPSFQVEYQMLDRPTLDHALYWYWARLYARGEHWAAEERAAELSAAWNSNPGGLSHRDWQNVRDVAVQGWRMVHDKCPTPNQLSLMKSFNWAVDLATLDRAHCERGIEHALYLQVAAGSLGKNLTNDLELEAVIIREKKMRLDNYDSRKKKGEPELVPRGTWNGWRNNVLAYLELLGVAARPQEEAAGEAISRMQQCCPNKNAGNCLRCGPSMSAVADGVSTAAATNGAHPAAAAALSSTESVSQCAGLKRLRVSDGSESHIGASGGVGGAGSMLQAPPIRAGRGAKLARLLEQEGQSGEEEEEYE